MHLTQQGLGITGEQIGIIDCRSHGLFEGEIWHEFSRLLAEHPSQSDFLLLVELRGEGEHGAFLEPEHAEVKVDGQQGRALLVPNQVEQLVERPREGLGLLAALSNQLGAHGVHRGHLHDTPHHLLALLEQQPQVVEGILPEALVLREGSDHLGGQHVQHRLQEVKKANLRVLVRV